MKFFNWLSWLVVVAVAVVVSADERTPPEELQIDTTYRPADCSAKAKKGDSIQVHYVRRRRRRPLHLNRANYHLLDRDAVLKWQ
jgi:hypothetical protein